MLGFVRQIPAFSTSALDTPGARWLCFAKFRRLRLAPEYAGLPVGFVLQKFRRLRLAPGHAGLLVGFVLQKFPVCPAPLKMRSIGFARQKSPPPASWQGRGF